MSTTTADRRFGGSADGKTAIEPPNRSTAKPPVLESRAYSFWYGPKQALFDVGCAIPKQAITSLIGPSVCGKLTFLRSINRMHDLTPRPRHSADILHAAGALFASGPAVVALRHAAGSVVK